MTDTIFALSSGVPPAGIAVVRVSGPCADAALFRISSGELPPPRVASLRRLHWKGETVDQAIVVRFPAPRSVTGEDIVELHLHGGRATVDAVYEALAEQPGLRLAQPGEFTRQAFMNGRIDLSEAEALGDLLRSETEGQRRAALINLSGGLRAVAENLRGALLGASARVEAAIDFAEEDDVLPWPEREQVLVALAETVSRYLASPPAERLHEGIKVVIAGPPNAGKSTLLNALVGRDAAIASPIAGTTRDAIEVSVRLSGIALTFVDTAGLRGAAADPIEAIGIERATEWLSLADIVIWLGSPAARPDTGFVIPVQAKCDEGEDPDGRLAVSALQGTGIPALTETIVAAAQTLLPGEDMAALNQRQRSCLRAALVDIRDAATSDDLLIVAEHLSHARQAVDRLTGRTGVEDMLDALFGEFCIGK